MMHLKVLFLVVAIFFAKVPTFGQVGLGVTSPTAMLEVKTEKNGLAGLGLSPQAHPIGQDLGQLAVIEDKLFVYYDTKNKWLSVETTNLEFGRLGLGSVPKEIEYGGGDVQTGVKMPFDGSIVSISIEARSVSSNRSVLLFINDTPVPNNDSNSNIDGVFDLTATDRSVLNNSYNIDFSEGDVIKFEVDPNVGESDIIDLTLVAQVKWRKDNN